MLLRTCPTWFWCLLSVPPSNGRSRRPSARPTASSTLKLWSPKSRLPRRPDPANMCPGTGSERRCSTCVLDIKPDGPALPNTVTPSLEPVSWNINVWLSFSQGVAHAGPSIIKQTPKVPNPQGGRWSGFWLFVSITLQPLGCKRLHLSSECSKY